MENIAILSCFLITVTTLYVLYYLSFRQLLNEDQQSQTNLNTQPLTIHDSVPWTQLGEQPAFGDVSDLGAVDIALKIKDLECFKDDAQNADEKAFYRQQIIEQSRLLADVTLVQVAPLDIPEDESFIKAPPENLIPFGKAKAFKKGGLLG